MFLERGRRGLHCRFVFKELGTDTFLYYEGGSELIVAISNYLSSRRLSNQREYLISLKCEIIDQLD